jgi:hypothetical protein
VILRCVTWLCGTLLVVGATGDPAVAETHAGTDPRRDVMRFTPSDEQPAPRVANGDIIRHRLIYRGDRLVAVVRFRALTQRARVLWVGVPITYPGGGGDRLYGEIELVITRKGPRQPEATFSQGSHPDCAVESRVSYGRDRIRFAMPASCMGSPKWIRAFTGSYRTDDLDKPTYFLADTSPDNLGGRPGPRIDRD